MHSVLRKERLMFERTAVYEEIGASHEQPTLPHPRQRRRLRQRSLITLLVILFVLIGSYFSLDLCYRGPRDMGSILTAMPGVPIFPLSSVANGNHRTQRALAIPLLLVRLQGVTRAEAALLQAPAGRDFVLDWYKTMAPAQEWELADQETLAAGTRLMFTRKREGFQVIVGAKSNTAASVQLVYLNGLTERQIQQMIEMPGSVPLPAKKEARNAAAPLQ